MARGGKESGSVLLGSVESTLVGSAWGRPRHLVALPGSATLIAKPVPGGCQVDVSLGAGYLHCSGLGWGSPILACIP